MTNNEEEAKNSNGALQMEEEEESPEQIRIQLKLSPYVKNKKYYELVSSLKNTEIAVPSSIRRKGLSLLVNHLLNDNSEEKEEEEDDAKKSSSNTSFDFLLNHKLLRTSLEIAARRDGIYNNFEECLIVEYFPSYNVPEESSKSEQFPDWIYDMSYCTTGGNTGSSVLVCGCYDGSIKLLSTSKGKDAEDGIVANWSSYNSHTSAIKCVDTLYNKTSVGGGNMIVATGGLDHMLKTHVYSEGLLDNTVEYINGHCNSIESTALRHSPLPSMSSDNQGEVMLASGDWDGGLCIWNVPLTNNKNDDDDEDLEQASSKRLKLQGGESKKEQQQKQQPTISLQAHTSSISGIAFSNITPNHIITSSHDSSLKLWDIQQQDCLLTLNGSRVITSIDIGNNADIVVTTHPDCTVRLWDVKSASTTSTFDASSITTDTKNPNIITNTTFKPSHKGYVSDVQWSPTNPFLFATTSHDGACKLWDIRSTLPLLTFAVCSKDAEQQKNKALCLEFGNCTDEKNEIFCAGTDCIVKQFSF